MKNMLILISAVTMACLSCPTAYGAMGQLDPLVLDAMRNVSEERLMLDAQVLTGERTYMDDVILSRNIAHPDHELAMAYLLGRLGKSGLPVWMERFPCDSVTGCANLIVELPGKESPEHIWLLGAHFDSTNGYDPAFPAPGAVDNASGVVVVLEALESLRHFQFRETIRFVLFDAEEEGLLGSIAHAEGAAARGEAIQVLVNLDVPGWRSSDYYAAFSSSDFPSWPELQTLNHIALRYPVGTLHVGVPLPANDSADMASFWEVGYRGFITGSLFAATGLMNTEGDVFDLLDVEQCANVARLVIAYLGERCGVLSSVRQRDVPR